MSKAFFNNTPECEKLERECKEALDDFNKDFAFALSEIKRKYGYLIINEIHLDLMKYWIQQTDGINSICWMSWMHSVDFENILEKVEDEPEIDCLYLYINRMLLKKELPVLTMAQNQIIKEIYDLYSNPIPSKLGIFGIFMILVVLALFAFLISLAIKILWKAFQGFGSLIDYLYNINIF
jgi:hypothetical protein